MGVSKRIDTFQRQHRWAAVPVAVGYEFIDDEGVYLGATSATTASSRCSRCCCSR